MIHDIDVGLSNVFKLVYWIWNCHLFSSVCEYLTSIVTFSFVSRILRWSRILWNQSVGGRHIMLRPGQLWILILNSLILLEKGPFHQWAVFGSMQTMWSVFMPHGNSTLGMHSFPHCIQSPQCAMVFMIIFYVNVVFMIYLTKQNTVWGVYTWFT